MLIPHSLSFALGESSRSVSTDCPDKDGSMGGGGGGGREGGREGAGEVTAQTSPACRLTGGTGSDSQYNGQLRKMTIRQA